MKGAVAVRPKCLSCNGLPQFSRSDDIPMFLSQKCQRTNDLLKLQLENHCIACKFHGRCYRNRGTLSFHFLKKAFPRTSSAAAQELVGELGVVQAASRSNLRCQRFGQFLGGGKGFARAGGAVTALVISGSCGSVSLGKYRPAWMGVSSRRRDRTTVRCQRRAAGECRQSNCGCPLWRQGHRFIPSEIVCRSCILDEGTENLEICADKCRRTPSFEARSSMNSLYGLTLVRAAQTLFRAFEDRLDLMLAD